MPLLAQEPFVYPHDLLCNPPDGDDGQRRWWVLHTRPRAEKALARRFFSRGTAYFLPQHRKQWHSRGRLLTSHLPLFPSYVFLYGDNQARVQALETNVVARVIPVADQM